MGRAHAILELGLRRGSKGGSHFVPVEHLDARLVDQLLEALGHLLELLPGDGAVRVGVQAVEHALHVLPVGHRNPHDLRQVPEGLVELEARQPAVRVRVEPVEQLSQELLGGQLPRLRLVLCLALFTATLTMHPILYYTAHFIARSRTRPRDYLEVGSLLWPCLFYYTLCLKQGTAFIQYIDQEQEAQPTMQPRGDKDNGQVSQRLWRKINSKPNVEDEKSTQKSLVKTFKSDAIMDSAPCEALASEVKEEPDITEFLMQVHHKMSNIDHDSESEIMERLSLEWPESANRSQSIIDRRSIFSQESSLLNQGWKTERDIGSQASVLKGIKNLQELQAYLSGINPLISDELGELMKENQKLVEECNSCKYNDKKTLLKIQLLNNQIHMLEKKNEELTADGERLRHELDNERVKQAHKTLEGKKGESGGGEAGKGQHNEKEQSGLKLSSSLDLNELRSPPGLQRTDSVASSQSSSPNLGNHDYQSIVAQIFRPAKRTRPVKQG